VIFSSRTIRNAKAVGSIINGLVAGRSHHRPHRSGPCLQPSRRDELRDMIYWVRPQILIPVHGEALHLAEHAKLARAGACQSLTCAPATYW
jgi:ribonuclease J